MKILSAAFETVNQLLRRFYKEGGEYRLLKYITQVRIPDGVLLLNHLTRELILLSPEEYSNIYENEYLKTHWFVIPQQLNERELADFVLTFLRSKRKNLDTITSFSVFTTTDCNARCFYCFEHGIKKQDMSPERARKVVQYIKEHSHGKKVNINWFGGEPLMNTQAIDIISQGLKDEGVEFKSRMITNGYLFTPELVKRAVSQWNLQKLQITLDGTEPVYNKIKAYIHPNVNAYRVVLQNIHTILDTDLKLSIRLNVDQNNAENLLSLARELYEEFGSRNNLNVYVHGLYETGCPEDMEAASAKAALMEESLKKIEDKLYGYGLKHRGGISNTLNTFHCMSDCGTSVTILPDGKMGLCETPSEDGYIGHMDTEGFDRQVIKNWREFRDPIPECDDCFYYPECMKLKKCANCHVCYPANRTANLRKTKESMLFHYNYLKTNGKA